VQTSCVIAQGAHQTSCVIAQGAHQCFVVQILAIKQAAATRANAAVEAVNRQIRDLEADWQGPSKKRQRRSL
jgi:hypothetical protein